MTCVGKLGSREAELRRRKADGGPLLEKLRLPTADGGGGLGEDHPATADEMIPALLTPLSWDLGGRNVPPKNERGVVAEVGGRRRGGAEFLRAFP
ncbi:hypothetical protein CF336_g7899 [Tilletia laevis]|nr:hypothetical protein CF336_g7899 [Tilletia laevis]